MKKIYIAIVRTGEDSGTIVQYAQSKKQARTLIDKILPHLEAGYNYKIV